MKAAAMSSWKLTGHASKAAVEAALVAHDEFEDWDPDIVLAGREIAEEKPNDWMIEAWMPGKPGKAERSAIGALFSGTPPRLKAEKLPETDWLVQSQVGVDPICAGRFYIHTPEHEPSGEAGIVSFSIPASQAFGTGQHETTAGCLAMLDHMRRIGVSARNVADIGTGTGLLAFAAMELWPRALATASDIDHVCAGVVEDNAHTNHVSVGHRAGELAMVIAAGMDDPLLQARGPYDVLIANILAGPLIELAEDFALSTSPNGSVVLAGLLETQERAVRAAYLRAGFRLAARLVNGDWSILWLRKRPDWR